MKSKCCNSDVFIKEKSGQKCVYCRECGKFVKNANKEDLRLIELEAFDGILHRPTPINPLNVDDLLKKIDYYKSSIKQMIADIDKMMDKEWDILPMSNEDAIRKSSKCYELDRCKIHLEEILRREN